MRAIQQAAELVARALRLLVANQPRQAEEQLSAGYAALALDRELLLLLDAATLRSQIKDDDRLEMAARLLLADAALRVHEREHALGGKLLRAARRLLALHPRPADDLVAELVRVESSLELDA